MELFFLEYSTGTITAALFLVFLALLSWYSVSAYSQLAKIGINHPKPSPFLGNMFFFKQGFWDGQLKLVKEYGRICGYYTGRQKTIVLADPEMIKQILVKNFNYFPNRMQLKLATKPLTDSILALRDDRWKHVRSVLTPAFSAAKMKEMAPLINQAADTLLENLRTFADAGEHMDVHKGFGYFTMDVVASVAFGTQVDSQKNPDDPFVKHAKLFFQISIFRPLIIISMMFPFIMMPVIRLLPNKRLEQINRFFMHVIGNIITQRDLQPPSKRRRDFLQLMLDARSSVQRVAVENFDIVNRADEAIQNQTLMGEPAARDKDAKKTLTDDEVVGQAFIVLLGGYETSSSALAFLVYSLARHPECQDKLLKEVDEFYETHEIPDYNSVQKLKYLDMVISETLRMYPPAFRFSRESAQDVVVNGQLFPAGVLVEVAVGYLHYDAEYWPEPEKFIPERFTKEAKEQRHPFVYLPFGAGPRSCIGMRLALLELKIAVVRIFQKYRFEVCPETQVPLQLISNTVLGPKDGIILKILSRQC
ncbi:thromboxane-A synthase isoform X1 [Latimeria chalumnae]|uniref:Thromboxane-A synthase n=3 Tax=Latimeria chalumnae TaxID=7897 RepID=H3B4L4_LATCH|nr:PREDICTED: thromboxane-A synthase [Latimeria chalumnae]XP_005989495.1 PREDICTED: thromboxane-A synthase [Latimeria chalumnae]|eukprot:XP_005989494.1 PREDICTED: thromboxane-A synthase [Latimeria chalumnae]